MQTTKEERGKVLVHPAILKMLTEASWEFALKKLWPETPISGEEADIAKSYIQKYYESIPAEKFHQVSSNFYLQFCQRIKLAKVMAGIYADYTIHHSVHWLHPLNTNGFQRTALWLEALEKIYKKRKRKIRSQLIIIPMNFSFTE